MKVKKGSEFNFINFFEINYSETHRELYNKFKSDLINLYEVGKQLKSYTPNHPLRLRQANLLKQMNERISHSSSLSSSFISMVNELRVQDTNVLILCKDELKEKLQELAGKPDMINNNYWKIHIQLNCTEILLIKSDLKIFIINSFDDLS